MQPDLGILVTARNEGERLAATLSALGQAFPGARVVVADDASSDGTAEIARAAGAVVASAPRRLGKGEAATLGVRQLLDGARGSLTTVVLCDGDLGRSAAALAALPRALASDGAADIAVAAFERRRGGGLGLVVVAARQVIARATGGPPPLAPLSGQRAVRAEHLPALLPFAAGFGMEVGMAIDAHRCGLGTTEVTLPLEHRSTGRTAAGFAHRGRQLVDVLRAAARRRGGPPRRSGSPRRSGPPRRPGR